MSLHDSPHPSNFIKNLFGNGIRLLHSGLLYPEDRDPREFFNALAELQYEGNVQKGEITIILRATGNDQFYTGILNELKLSSIVQLLPPLPYQQALEEMLSVDGLLIFQAKNCNHQIPAKVYEYLRAQRPIFSLTYPEGDTANLLWGTGVNHIAKLDDKHDIKSKFLKFLDAIKNNKIVVPSMGRVQQYSRASGAKKLHEFIPERPQ